VKPHKEILDQFTIPGVPQEQIWQVFNVSNWQYYREKVRGLITRICPFCTVDPKVNQTIVENESWRCWENNVAPRKGAQAQLHQFVIPLKRHVVTLDQLCPAEMTDLLEIVRSIETRFEIAGGVYVIRSGDSAYNAKSVDHLHVNYHVPTGIERVEITIAKSIEDLKKKSPYSKLLKKCVFLKRKAITVRRNCENPTRKPTILSKTNSNHHNKTLHRTLMRSFFYYLNQRK